MPEMLHELSSPPNPAPLRREGEIQVERGQNEQEANILQPMTCLGAFDGVYMAVSDYATVVNYTRQVLARPIEELAALKHLSDDALWTIAADQLPASVQARMQTLMDHNSVGQITDADYKEFEALVERGNRFMVRKAEASVILIEHGHTFTQEDFQQKREG